MRCDNPVLITGSTGFIGGHLARRLVSNGNVVRCLVKDHFTSTDRIDGLGIEQVFGDMTSLAAMRKAMQGCKTVVHCAIGQPRENALGTKTVIQAAFENKVKKFIHLSSTAAFGYWPSISEIKDGRLKKPHSEQNYLNDYCFSKIDSEEIAFSYYESGKLPVVVLRLSNVYGPHSAFWTLTPLQMIKQGCFTLIDGGYSPSNTVYIDNAVDAIELAIDNDDAVGQAFVVSDEEPTSWRQFFTEYHSMLRECYPLKEIGHEKLLWYRRKNYALIMANALRIKIAKKVKNALKINYQTTPISGELINCKKASNRCMQATLPSNESKVSLKKIPPLWLEKSFILPYKFSVDGARDVLRFRSRTSFKEGMNQTANWLHTEMGLLN